jgi:glycosyltransferase involved in cell wall biosynthesis
MRDTARQTRDVSAPGTVAYVLKSFPRLSETFIVSEIARLERRGVALRIYVIKRPDEHVEHPIVATILAPRVHLPHAAPISSAALWPWVKSHLPSFLAPLARQTARSPLRMVRAIAVAIAYAVRARKGRWAAPRASALKEFLQAAALADAMAADADVRHVHAHFCHSATTIAWLASVMTGRSLSFTAHAKDLYCAELNPAGLLERKLAAARFVVSCTRAGQRFLQARTDTSVHCVYHGLGVDFQRICASIPERHEVDGSIRALAVGRLVEKKGFDVFLEACALLRVRGLPLHATIVGERGEHETALHARAAAPDLAGHVRFTGPLAQPDLVREYLRASVFCLPCRVLGNGDRDGIPNVVAEAMACGLPVVTTDRSAATELIDNGTNGFVVPPNDPVAVADAIERLHRNRGLACRIGRNARLRIRERFDGDASVEELATLLREQLA